MTRFLAPRFAGTALALLLLAPALAGAALPLGDGVVPASGQSVSVPRTLDGAWAAYDFAFSRAPLLAAASTSGSGSLNLSVIGAAPVKDASGALQGARTFTFDAAGFADVVGHTWENLEGSLTYALDPVSGAPVRLEMDADVDWTSATTSRLRLVQAFNLLGELPAADTLLPLVLLLDTIGDRTYSEGTHLLGEPGPAAFSTAGAMETLTLAPPSRGGGGRGDPFVMVHALPVSFYLEPVAGIEASGTVWLVDGEPFPAKVVLRYLYVPLGIDLGAIELHRRDQASGAPLPSEVAPFVHPSVDPEAELSPPLATGSRSPSWALRPSVEEAFALVEALPEFQAYKEQYPSVFPAVILDRHSYRQTARLSLVSEEARALGDRAYGYPLWTIAWYATEDPGVRLVTAVSVDRVTGEFRADLQIQAGALSTVTPAATLTTSSALDRSEHHSPALADDPTSEALLAYLAEVNLWILSRGTGVDPARLVAEPTSLLHLLQPELPVLCAVVPPEPGTTAVLSGSTGLLVAVQEATYHTPRVAPAGNVAACGGSLVDIAAYDPFAPETAARVLTDADAQASAALTYATFPHRPRAPILIESDAMLDAPSAVSGVVGGTGTRLDPYVISGWNLRTPSQDVPAITLRNTTKHVLVKDNALHGEGIGVHVDRARNVRVEDNRIPLAGIGILVTGLSGGSISRNAVAHASFGILVQNHLLFNPATLKIAATPVTGLAIEGNRVDRATIGILYAGTYGRFADNRIEGNLLSRSVIGLAAADATHTRIAGNAYNNNDRGAYVQGGGAGLVLEDELYAANALAGLHLVAVNGLAASRLRFEDGEAFGLLAAASQATVAGLEAEGNRRGLVAVKGADVSVQGGRLVGNGEFGAFSDGASLMVSGAWWGSSAGPGGCATGGGDRVSCGVAFEPFRLSP